MDKTFGKKNYENISKKHQTNDKKISTCKKRIISTRNIHNLLDHNLLDKSKCIILICLYFLS